MRKRRKSSFFFFLITDVTVAHDTLSEGQQGIQDRSETRSRLNSRYVATGEKGSKQRWIYYVCSRRLLSTVLQANGENDGETRMPRFTVRVNLTPAWNLISKRGERKRASESEGMRGRKRFHITGTCLLFMRKRREGVCAFGLQKSISPASLLYIRCIWVKSIGNNYSNEINSKELFYERYY